MRPAPRHPSERRPIIQSREAMRDSDSTKLLHKTGSNYQGAAVNGRCSPTQAIFVSTDRLEYAIFAC